MSESLICEDCGDKIDPHDPIEMLVGHIGVNAHAKMLCRTCAETNYFNCQHCDQNLPVSEQAHQHNGETLCNTCHRQLITKNKKR